MKTTTSFGITIGSVIGLFVFTLLTLLTYVPVFAATEVTITNNATQYPHSYSLDNTVSVCIASSDGTSTSVDNIASGQSVATMLEPGTHEYVVVRGGDYSFIAGTTNPSNACEFLVEAVDADFVFDVTIATGEFTTNDDNTYELNIQGSSQLADPRLLGIDEPGSYYVSYATPDSDTATTGFIIMRYPDFYFDQNGNLVRGPLQSTLSACIDTGNGFELVVNPDNNTYGLPGLYFENLPLNTDIQVGIPSLENGCITPLAVQTVNLQPESNNASIFFNNGYFASGVIGQISSTPVVVIDDQDEEPGDTTDTDQSTGDANGESSTPITTNTPQVVSQEVVNGESATGNQTADAPASLIRSGGAPSVAVLVILSALLALGSVVSFTKA